MKREAEDARDDVGGLDGIGLCRVEKIGRDGNGYLVPLGGTRKVYFDLATLELSRIDLGLLNEGDEVYAIWRHRSWRPESRRHYVARCAFMQETKTSRSEIEKQLKVAREQRSMKTKHYLVARADDWSLSLVTHRTIAVSYELNFDLLEDGSALKYGDVFLADETDGGPRNPRFIGNIYDSDKKHKDELLHKLGTTPMIGYDPIRLPRHEVEIWRDDDGKMHFFKPEIGDEILEERGRFYTYVPMNVDDARISKERRKATIEIAACDRNAVVTNIWLEGKGVPKDIVGKQDEQ